MDGEDDDDEDDDDEDDEDEDDDDYDTKVWKSFSMRNITYTPFLASEYPLLFGKEDQGNCWRGRAAG